MTAIHHTDGNEEYQLQSAPQPSIQREMGMSGVVRQQSCNTRGGSQPKYVGQTTIIHNLLPPSLLKPKLTWDLTDLSKFKK